MSGWPHRALAEHLQVSENEVVRRGFTGACVTPSQPLRLVHVLMSKVP